MKRALRWCGGVIFVTLVGTGGSALGADAGGQAAAIAERQELREALQSLSAKVDDLWTAQAAQQKRVVALGEEINRLRMEQDRGVGKLATREELQKLSESVRQAVRELDEKRIADRKLILEELRKLEKMPVVTAPVAPPSSVEGKGRVAEQHPKGSSGGGSGPGETVAAPREGYEYEVRKDDTLSTILQAYNDEFKKQGKKTLTLKQVLDLEENKHIKPNALRVGQKIFIPDPPKKP